MSPPSSQGNGEKKKVLVGLLSFFGYFLNFLVAVKGGGRKKPGDIVNYRLVYIWCNAAGRAIGNRETVIPPNAKKKLVRAVGKMRFIFGCSFEYKQMFGSPPPPKKKNTVYIFLRDIIIIIIKYGL